MAAPLYLISGLNNTRDVFEGVVAALGPEIDCRIYEPPALSTVEAIAEDFLANSEDEFWLAGFSFGGYVALAILEAAPERVLGFALIGATPAADPDDKKPVREKLATMAETGNYPDMVSKRAPGVFHPSHEDDPGLNATRHRMFGGYGAARFAAHNRACAARPDRHHLIGTLSSKPLLLAAGEADPLAPRAALEKAASLHPSAKISIVDGAAHLVPMEQPEALAAGLLSWMQS